MNQPGAGSGFGVERDVIEKDSEAARAVGKAGEQVRQCGKIGLRHLDKRRIATISDQLCMHSADQRTFAHAASAPQQHVMRWQSRRVAAGVFMPGL